MRRGRRADWQRPDASRPNARTATVRAIIERGIAERGLAPSDDEIARTLAISVVRVQHHRRLLGM